MKITSTLSEKGYTSAPLRFYKDGNTFFKIYIYFRRKDVLISINKYNIIQIFLLLRMFLLMKANVTAGF